MKTSVINGHWIDADDRRVQEVGRGGWPGRRRGWLKTRDFCLMTAVIDPHFDFPSDTPAGKDPDTWSPTLARYHQLLWSKHLPSGHRFDLALTGPPFYLRHQSHLGDYWLSSDATIHTYAHWAKTQHIIERLPASDLAEFQRIAYQIGGMVVWPANRIDNMMTINGAKGFAAAIADRLDLTLECLRRFYVGDKSPLADVLSRYLDYFALFEDFRGFVDFFFLQDLVRDGSESLRFFLPFTDFQTQGHPHDIQAYLEYRDRSIEFVAARNSRIATWVATQT